MPGQASLRAGRYYAFPRNAFWPIIEVLFGIAADADYGRRCAALTQRGVAVWDVLKSCSRDGSLDAAIDAGSMVPNDFRAFFTRYPSIEAIYFNGAMAERAYRRYVLPELPEHLRAITASRLPSTSPANAAYSFARKLSHWRQIGELLSVSGSQWG